MAKNVDVAQALNFKFQSASSSYTERDTILYALGVGEGKNATDPKSLRFTYENHSDFSPLPTMAVCFLGPFLEQVISVPGLTFNPMMLLHGGQYLELRAPLPPAATLVSEGRLTSIYDKGSGALVTIHITTKDKATGKELCFNEISLFIRGIGGFGGDRGPSEPAIEIPKRAPDAVVEEKTHPEQALLYRLSGDYNPLHADPEMAAMGNFDRPILHGLCSYGVAGRAVLHNFCGSDPTRFKAIKAKFVKHVFPGETIKTEMWKVSPSRIVFRCSVKEREGVVMNNAYVDIVPNANM